MDNRKQLVQMSQELFTSVRALVPNEIEKFNARNDAWTNLLTGMGTKAYDKRVNTLPGVGYRFDKRTLSEMYSGQGVLSRMIDIPVDDSIREWFYVEGDPEGLILKELSRIKLKKLVKEAMTWARLHGGAVIFLFIDDGEVDPVSPVNLENISTINGGQVYDRWDVTWTQDNLYQDKNDPKFGKPEIYTINNTTTGTQFPVHESRLLIFDGEQVDDQIRSENNGWGDPLVKKWFEQIRGLGEGTASAEALISEFIMGIYKIENLESLLDSNDGRTKIRNRLQILDMAKHILNSLAIDTKEDFTRVSSSGVGGMSDILDFLKGLCTTVSGIPVIKLFGEQSQGLGSQASGNIRFYYDDIATLQEFKYLDPFSKIIEYVMLQTEGPFNGNPLEEYEIVFNALWQQTEKEEAETRKIHAETDQIYYNMGVPYEIIVMSRFAGNMYSKELVLPEKYVQFLESQLVSFDTPEEDMDNLEI